MSQMSREDVRERLGNIDQIRDIIFGTQLREYENRFSKIESDISLLQQQMRSHVDQLKANFATELKGTTEALEKKLKLLSVNTQEETADLRQVVDRLNRKFSGSIESFDEVLYTQTTSIRDELSQNKVQFQDDIMALRDLLLEELERRFSQLRENKVSKDDIAETLFALGMRIKGTELMTKLNQAVDESNHYSNLPILQTKKVSAVLTHMNGTTAEIES